jgi:hypothetical protein
MTRYPRIRPSLGKPCLGPVEVGGGIGDGAVTFEEVKEQAGHLPEVTESTSYGTPSLKVRGKSFCRLWGEREYERYQVHDTEVLVVFCEVDEKALLIAMSGGTLFTTPHYDGHGAVLIRLEEIDGVELADHLERSYRLKAPASLRKRLDER